MNQILTLAIVNNTILNWGVGSREWGVGDEGDEGDQGDQGDEDNYLNS
ncbi:hypothetical protein [Nostoc sp.]